MSERKPNPSLAPNISRPGESLEKTGTKRVTELLPDILKTTVNKQFFDSTFEQLLASGSLESIRHFVGETTGDDVRDAVPAVTDNYLLDNRSNDPYQFQPGAVTKSLDNKITHALAYDDLLRSFDYNEVDTNNHHKFLAELGYTLDLPINYDMFINYQRYYWVLDVMPPCELQFTSGFDMDTINGETSYTTPVMKNGKTLTLENGMRIKLAPHTVDRFTQTNSANTTFTATVQNGVVDSLRVYKNNTKQNITADYTYNATTGVVTFTTAPAVDEEIEIHTYYSFSTSGTYENDAILIVDGVGDPNGIVLTTQFSPGQYEGKQGKRVWCNITTYSAQEPSGFDEDQYSFDFRKFDLREHRMTTRDYTCEQRQSPDQSAWSRSNLWVHEETIKNVLIYQAVTDDVYTLDRYRAVRPIIEYKANLEKFNFGKKHVANVDHALESAIDPATVIVGQTDFNVFPIGFTTEWVSGQGYDFGEKVKVTSGSTPNLVITYWECVKAHGEERKPTHGENLEFWEQVTPVELENKDLIIFFNTTNSAYTNKIFEVSGVGTSIVLTETYNFDGSNSATKLNAGEKVLILNGHNVTDKVLAGESVSNREAPLSGSEIYFNGTTWVQSQQKEHRSQGMKVQLYDVDLIKLDNVTQYPDSDFNGSTIFDFVHSTTSSFDTALGFNAEYVDYGNTPGINFESPLLSKKSTYVQQSNDGSKNQIKNISGQYYYKDFVSGRYYNGWTADRFGQVVKKRIRKVITDPSVPLLVDVGHSKTVSDRYYNIFQESGTLAVSTQPTADVSNGRVTRVGGKLPTLFFFNDNTYTVSTHFPQAQIEFVNMDGSAVGNGILRTAGSGNSFNIVITTPTVNSIKYRLVADPTKFGVIFFTTNANETNVEVRKNGKEFTNFTHINDIVTINTGLILDDIYEFVFKSDANYSATGEGNFEVASTQLSNPLNQNFEKVSYGDLVRHLTSQMKSNPLFTGNLHGTNNYRNIVQTHDTGGLIKQQPFSTELANQLLVDNNTNPYSALQFTNANYNEFINKFKNKITQLHNSTEINVPVYQLVDKTLEALNIGKNNSNAFAGSQMAMYRDYKSFDGSWVLNQTPTFDLPEEVNIYDDTFNHVQVWIQIPDANGEHTWRGLVKDVDYTMDDYSVTVTLSGITFPGSGKNNIHIRWYKRGSVSFVPYSAVKLGMIKPFVPELRSDYSKDSTGTATDSVIIGHDGNVHVRNGTELYARTVVGFDPVDAGLWDLELRIYNNLNSNLDNVVNQSTYSPNAHRPAVYTWNEVNNTIRSEFNKYKSANNIVALNSTTYFDGSDKFTWNYSSVSPNIGGWRGIYHYFFRTDRPHTHTWEMLGFNKKPTWWDTNYSWTDATKRSALLYALEFGLISQPGVSETFDVDYSYKNYDWQNNTLVTLLGVLNDPITAGVCSTPTLEDRQKDFVFGDWGPVEAEWRRTSQGKITNIISFMRTRPLIALNNYFRTQRRIVKNLTGYDIPYIMDIAYKGLNSWKSTALTGSSNIGKIIESVNIVNPGSGYTSSPNVIVTDNFGSGGAVVVKVENGSVVGAKVNFQGVQYYNRPQLDLSTGNAVLDPILADDTKTYFDGLANAIIEFGNTYGTDADALAKRFYNISFRPIIKAGGFVKRNQQFILESSQDKGRVFVPEENVDTLLYTNKPSQEYFFGGIKVNKTANGYTINGYDNSLAYFNYYKPKTSTPGVTVSFEGITTVQVLRYNEYEDILSQLDYNTELNSIQEVYNFINGYGHYLNTLGFSQQWRSSASNFVTWAVGSSTTELSLIPDSSRVTVNDGQDGYFDNIDKRYDGVYNIIDANGNQIRAYDILIDRKSMEPDSETVFQVKDEATQIYGIRLYKVQLEHIFIFDNVTNFDDAIHDPTIFLAHKRIIWRGSRTKDWNGKLYSPGYIVNDNTILPNFDTTAREVDQYYGRTKTLGNKQISDVARFNAGYNRPEWSQKLDLDDDAVYEFVKGSYKYRGTDHTLSAFMRNNGLFDGEASAELLENWAIRTADFGDTRKRETLEFQIKPDLLTTSPQPIRFTDGLKHDVLSDIVIDIDSISPLKVYDSGTTFNTRPVNNYKSTSDELFDADLNKAGLPLLSESDYRVINKEDFTQFPTEVKPVYDHNGDWQNIGQWDSTVSYKFNEKVLYNGRSWAMLDEDGSSGFSTSNDPIDLLGSNQLPVIPSAGQTLIIDGNTITLSKTATSQTRNTITVTGNNNIANNNVVTHGSTVILGESSTNNTTITFSNSVITTTFNDITKTGSTINPSFTGSATSTLIVEGTTITFSDTVSSSSNITAQTAYENAFNASWISNQSAIGSTASDRIARIEGLRAAYVAANSAAAWTTWMLTYYTNNAGLNISHLLTEIGLAGATATAAQLLLDQDLIIINNIMGTNYLGTNVANGSEVVAPSDITNSQAAMNNGSFTANIANYLKSASNASTTFTSNTIVTTQSSTNFKVYQLSDIVQEINDASISNVTASADANSRLKITKTTNDNTASFSLSISVGTLNSTVGFNSATETINSTSSSTQSTPNLTIQQVLDQINDAGVSGVSAQLGTNNNSLLQINSTLPSLFVGAGTANTIIGLPTGVVPATVTTATSSIGLNITDIVERINIAAISGVTAVNQSNKVKITSTNSTLVIGAGTANSTIGFIAQTYSATQSQVSAVFNALVDANGIPVFKEQSNDPNIFNIWVADDSEFGNYNLGYQVYQTMDFGMYTYDICAGVVSADEAQIKVRRQSGDTQAHNLSVGDYILIRGSDSVPNIDGIHRVTRTDANTSIFYIDEFIETNGHVGNIYPLRKMRFGSYAELEANRQDKVNGVFKYNFADVRQNNTSNPIYAFVDEDGTGASAVYSWLGTWSENNGHVGSWNKIRTGIKQARNDLIENIKLYNADTQTTITTLEIFDPAKGILFGFVDNEIDFKITNDIANYNYNNIDGEVINVEAWGRKYIGRRWWNTSTSVYLDYEQGSIDYQQNNWGRLADGASVDIYEWTASPVLPEQWTDLVASKVQVDGNEASGEVYGNVINGQTVYNWTEENYYNDKRKQTETTYYFWVKNKTSSIRKSNYNILQVAQIINNPANFNLAWAAQTGNDTILLSNIRPFVSNSTVAQVNLKVASNASPMQEWLMLAEGDTNATVPEYLHIKMRDSLAGFNRFSIDKPFTAWSSSTVYAKDAVVIENNEYYISLVSNNTNQQPNLDTDMSHWSRIYDFNLVESTQSDDISIWRGQPVPDLKLHKYNRYGHQVRPRQSLFRNLKDARQNFVHSVNSLLSEVNVIDEINNWENAFSTTFVEGTVTYRVKDYVNLIDWHLVERDDSGNITYRFNPNTVADLVYNTFQDYLEAGEPESDGSYVLIKSSSPGADIDRSEMYHFTGGTDKLVFKEKATVQISEEMWNQAKFGHGFDTIGFDVTPFDSCSDNVIGKLMDLLRTEIFIGRHHVMYNKMWFKLLYNAILQNTASDFAFKTTYTHLGVKRPLLTEKQNYQEYNIQTVEDFVKDIKPFHTKLLSSMESNTFSEATNIEIDEEPRTGVITLKYEDHSVREWEGDTVLLGGQFGVPHNTNLDQSQFTTAQSSFTDEYNGNVFQQTALEGWGEELVPTDYTENIAITVQTNTSGSILDADSRTFRMSIYQPDDIQISNVIVDTQKTQLSSPVLSTDTTISVTDATVLDDPNTFSAVPGVIYIGTERIEYNAIDGNNLLFCTRGTLGTSAEFYDSGAPVVHSGPSTRIPTLEKFSHYGDGLRLAYNDSGTSLASAGTSPEHAFIRNAGPGSI